MAILFFEGVDKVGKTTLFREVLKRTNKHICIDRFTASQYIYGKFHKKGMTITEVREIEYKLSYSGLKCAFIFVVASEEDIKKRFEETNEKDIEINDIKYLLNEYYKYFINFNRFCNIPVLLVDTSLDTIENCTNEVIKFANNL